MNAVAADANASPALVASAAAFTRLAGLAGPQADAGVRTLLDDVLKAMGSKPRPALPERSTGFDLRYLHA
jgi:hypothetical protein